MLPANTPVGTILLSRAVRGPQIPVKVLQSGFLVGTERHGTAASLLTRLHRTGRDPKIGFARYFHLDAWEAGPITTLTLFHPPDIQPGPTLGIDLHGRGHEVRKLFFAGFGRHVRAMGVDPEDALQEVFKGLLVRNRGTCPFDPRKSSFSHYVHMVATCVLSNLRKAETRRQGREILGAPSLTDGSLSLGDVSVSATEDSETDWAARARSSIRHLEDAAGPRARTILPMVLEGRPTTEMMARTGWSRKDILREARKIRDAATGLRDLV